MCVLFCAGRRVRECLQRYGVSAEIHPSHLIDGAVARPPQERLGRGSDSRSDGMRPLSILPIRALRCALTGAVTQ